MDRTFEPEFAFLCALARPHPDHGRAFELATNGLNWARVELLAAAHGVRPHLLTALKDSDVTELREFRHNLQKFWRGHATRNLFAAGELARIANCFDRRGIGFATFKGVGLAVSLYGDPSRREFNDIDIIVRPADLEAAESALESCGYHAAIGSNRDWRKAFLGYQRQYMFVREDSSLAVDLHWDFFPHDFAFPLRASDVWNRLDHVSIGGRLAPTLDAETLAIYLVGHGAKEGWKCLGWICDFADFYTRRPDIDWAGLFHRLDRGGRQRLLAALLLAKTLLGVSVREELLNDASDDAKIGSQLALVLRRLASAGRPKSPHPEMSLSGLATCHGWREKARGLWLLAATRTVSDYNALPLPRPAWRFYHLIRLFRLPYKALMVRIKFREAKQQIPLANLWRAKADPHNQAARDDASP